MATGPDSEVLEKYSLPVCVAVQYTSISLLMLLYYSMSLSVQTKSRGLYAAICPVTWDILIRTPPD